MYILTQFDGLTLPVGSPRHTAGTAMTSERTVQVMGGGMYDAWGAAQARPRLPQEITYDCKAYASTAAALRSTLDALRAKRGRRGRLYRRGLDDDELQWATARLMEVDYNTQAQHSHGLFQPLALRWSVQSLWHGALHGAPWTLDDGELLDGGLDLDLSERYALTTTPITLTITNNGNTAVEDVRVVVENGTYALTEITVRCGDCELVFGGTVGANKTLEIDCSPAALSVLNDGAAAWNDLTLGANHASEAWLRLEPGANSVVVSRTGGWTNSYITFEFSDCWE